MRIWHFNLTGALACAYSAGGYGARDESWTWSAGLLLIVLVNVVLLVMDVEDKKR